MAEPLILSSLIWLMLVEVQLIWNHLSQALQFSLSWSCRKLNCTTESTTVQLHAHFHKNNIIIIIHKWAGLPYTQSRSKYTSLNGYGFLDFALDFWISRWISGFRVGFLDFTLDFWISFGFLDFLLDFWISLWISDFWLDFYRRCTRFQACRTPRR